MDTLRVALAHEIALLDGVDDGVSPERSAQYKDALRCWLLEVEAHLEVPPACEARIVATMLATRAEADATRSSEEDLPPDEPA